MNTKEEIAQELEIVGRRSRELLEDLSDEQLRVPYERGINPPIWELGHAAFFFEYFLVIEVAAWTRRRTSRHSR